MESPVEVRRQGLPPVTSCRSRAEVEPPCRARVLAVEARVVAVEPPFEPPSSPRRRWDGFPLMRPSRGTLRLRLSFGLFG